MIRRLLESSLDVTPGHLLTWPGTKDVTPRLKEKRNACFLDIEHACLQVTSGGEDGASVSPGDRDVCFPGDRDVCLPGKRDVSLQSEDCFPMNIRHFVAIIIEFACAAV